MKKIGAAAIAAAALGALVAAGPSAMAQTDPNAPQLRVVDVTSDYVDLAWSATPGATDYLIDGSPCSPVDTGLPLGNEPLAYRLNSSNIDPNCGMVPGQTYNIDVRAKLSGLGNFSKSNIVSVQLP